MPKAITKCLVLMVRGLIELCCRFEKLDITPKSAQKIKPVLERWMKEAEERLVPILSNITKFTTLNLFYVVKPAARRLF